MLFIHYIYLYLCVLFVHSQHTGVSINRPKLSNCSVWNTNGITLANSILVGTNPGTVFVNANGTIYVTDRTNYRVQIWYNSSTNVTRTLTGGLGDTLGLTVSTNGEVYVDNGFSYNQINKWTLNSRNSSIATYFTGGRCYGLFIDNNNTLYCSLKIHEVLRTSLNNTGDNMTEVVAGTGTAGYSADMLNWPRGIFVDINYDLYVADGNNNRIQKFLNGQKTGITVVGSGSLLSTFLLNGPSSVVLDSDGYLFIVDQNNHRVVGSNSNGYQCLVGCSQQAGSTSSQLRNPYSMSFDQYGNIYVTDKDNGRIQIFTLVRNSCDVVSTQQPIITSTSRQLTTSSTGRYASNTTTRQKTTPSSSSVEISTANNLLRQNNCFILLQIFIIFFFIFNATY